MNEEKFPVVIIGTGGSSKEIYYVVKNINKVYGNEYRKILGFVGKDPREVGQIVFDQQKIIGTDESMRKIASFYSQIGIIIPLSDPMRKEALYLKYKKIRNAIFPNIVHPSVIIEGECNMGIGNIISAGCVLACNSKFGNFNLINRCCTTGHDVVLGDYNTVNPSTVISGDVIIKNKCLVGAGSIILQGLTVKNRAVLGAGAVLTKNVEEGEMMVGVPAVRFGVQ